RLAMSPEMWRQVDEIYDEVMKMPPGERERSLSAACAGAPPAVRAKVEELLQLPPEEDGPWVKQFELYLQALKEGAPEPPPETRATAAYEPIAERPGTVIGPYKLKEQIGEGGMGLVFVAEQQQPVRRKVALKIIKPGMDSKQVIARFEAERQA